MRMLLQKRFQSIVVFHREKSRSGLPAVARCPFLCMFTCLWVSETLKKLLSGSFRVEGKHNTMSRRHDTAKYINKRKPTSVKMKWIVFWRHILIFFEKKSCANKCYGVITWQILIKYLLNAWEMVSELTLKNRIWYLMTGFLGTMFVSDWN